MICSDSLTEICLSSVMLFFFLLCSIKLSGNSHQTSRPILQWRLWSRKRTSTWNIKQLRSEIFNLEFLQWVVLWRKCSWGKSCENWTMIGQKRENLRSLSKLLGLTGPVLVPAKPEPGLDLPLGFATQRHQINYFTLKQ